MPKVDLAYCMTLPPRKAVEYLKNKGYAVTWDWEELWQEAQAFWAACWWGYRLLKPWLLGRAFH